MARSAASKQWYRVRIDNAGGTRILTSAIFTSKKALNAAHRLFKKNTSADNEVKKEVYVGDDEWEDIR